MPTNNKVDKVDKVVEVEYDGETYTLPPLKTWPLEAQEAQEEGKDAAAVKLVIGDQYEKKFKKKKRSIGDLQDFIEAMFEAMSAALEAEEGESSGS